MRCLRATFSTWSSSCRPASPVSRNPPEPMTTFRIPRRPHSSSVLGTPAAGMMIIARSTGSGTPDTVL